MHLTGVLTDSNGFPNGFGFRKSLISRKVDGVTSKTDPDRQFGRLLTRAALLLAAPALDGRSLVHILPLVRRRWRRSYEPPLHTDQHANKVHGSAE